MQRLESTPASSLARVDVKRGYSSDHADAGPFVTQSPRWTGATSASVEASPHRKCDRHARK
jgi:hypothetical protein